MPRYLDVLWDLPDDERGNVQHIAQHGLERDEVADVLCDPSIPEETSRSSGNPMVRGYTSTGRYIVVIYEVVDPITAYPLSAYEVEP